MPDGRTHFGLLLLSVPAVIAFTMLWFNLRAAFVVAPAMILGDLLLSPDLDHQAGANSYRAWGIIRLVWYPYARMISHRSFISHGPIVGTAGRLLYLAIIPAVVITINSWWPQAIAWFDHNQSDVIFAVAGVEASSLVHIAADRLG